MRSDTISRRIRGAGGAAHAPAAAGTALCLEERIGRAAGLVEAVHKVATDEALPHGVLLTLTLMLREEMNSLAKAFYDQPATEA